MSALYSTQATALGGRVGSVASADGHLRVELSQPRALGGAGGEGTNPEQLVAAALAACLLDTIRQVGATEGIAVAHDSNVTAAVEMAAEANAPQPLRFSLSVDLPGIDPEIASRIVTTAQGRCPLSLSLRGRVDLRIWAG
ncbi:Ohr family peroxiredoxin [Sphingomonas sp. BK345]|uniref:Ohr family peroxiredoxin n=1 Tax=Sphingomonas sp. BK345 TaxID=2586980 RepID=UPI0016136F93|nr:Ohr family peroxiredoxin [Sphingomonas sp. BK345]MBB3473567.1 Ohr subfamily peroxiredoxin [Sphingomonas sp. BK345]